MQFIDHTTVQDILTTMEAMPCLFKKPTLISFWESFKKFTQTCDPNHYYTCKVHRATTPHFQALKWYNVGINLVLKWVYKHGKKTDTT